MAATRTVKLVDGYVQKWPREIFERVEDEKPRKPLIAKSLDMLNTSGVYVLYNNNEPCYVGKATNIRRRLNAHANAVNSRLYRGWNCFSAFFVRDTKQMAEVEGILIAAMPTANGARPRLPKHKVPLPVRRIMKSLRSQHR
jgi:hypothetical protein